MRFDCDRKLRRRLARKHRQKTWHRKFAWLPVRVALGDCRWLEIVERRREDYASGGWYWEYRDPLP